MNTKHLSPGFFYALRQMVDDFNARGANVRAEDFLGAWLYESRIRSDVPNRSGKPYYGLNQMGVTEMKSVGFTGSPSDWLALTPEEQLPYVRRFYEQKVANRDIFKGDYSRLKGGVGQIYAINYLPARSPRADDVDAPLTQRGESYYDSNSSLDFNKDGVITARDLSSVVERTKNSPQIAPYWNEVVSRYYAESGDSPSKPFPWGLALGLLGVGAVGTLFLAYKRPDLLPRPVRKVALGTLVALPFLPP